jgi:hypothetical protein
MVPRAIGGHEHRTRAKRRISFFYYHKAADWPLHPASWVMLYVRIVDTTALGQFGLKLRQRVVTKGALRPPLIIDRFV